MDSTGVNAANGFTGDLLMLQTNGSPVLRVDAANPAVYMNYANENTYLAYAQVSQNLGVSVLYAISPTMSMQGALTTIAAASKKQGTPEELKGRAVAIALATKVLSKL